MPLVFVFIFLVFIFLVFIFLDFGLPAIKKDINLYFVEPIDKCALASLINTIPPKTTRKSKRGPKRCRAKTTTTTTTKTKTKAKAKAKTNSKNT